MFRARLLLSTVAAASAVSLLAACSSDSGSSSSSSGSGSGSSSPSSSASDSNRVSAATLKSVVLRAGDLPSSWTAKAHDASDDAEDSDDTTAQQLAACIGTSVTPPKVDPAAKYAVHSQDFGSGQNEITSRAQPALSVAEQKTFDKEVVASSKASTCIAKVFTAVATKAIPGATVSNVEASATGPKSGQPSSVQVNLEAQLTVTAQGETHKLDFYTADLLTDSIEAEVDVNAVDGVVSDSTKQAAVNAVGKRVADA